MPPAFALSQDQTLKFIPSPKQNQLLTNASQRPFIKARSLPSTKKKNPSSHIVHAAQPPAPKHQNARTHFLEAFQIIRDTIRNAPDHDNQTCKPGSNPAPSPIKHHQIMPIQPARLKPRKLNQHNHAPSKNRTQNATNVSLPNLYNCQRTSAKRTKRRDKVSRREAQQISPAPDQTQGPNCTRWSDDLFLEIRRVNPDHPPFRPQPVFFNQPSVFYDKSFEQKPV